MPQNKQALIEGYKLGLNAQNLKRENVIKLIDKVQFGTIKIVKKDGKILFSNVELDGEEMLDLIDKNTDLGV